MHRSATPIYVLLVEDEPQDAELTRMVLEKAGMRVTVAGDLAEARAALDMGSYEVLVVDLKLPDGEGLELFAEAQEKDPHAVGIVLTGYASTETAVNALRRGAYDFLTKPCPTEVLVAAVRRGAERQRLARELAHRTEEVEALNRQLDKRVKEGTRQIFLLNERLKRFIVQLMDANDQRTKFLDNVTHELKHPLAVVWGHASHLLSRPLKEWTSEELTLSLGAIHRNSQGLNSMLEEMMDAARISSHKVMLRREALHASEQVREIVEAFCPQASAKGIWLAADCPEGNGPGFSGDKLRLRQILSNLISNALKFTPAGGKVTVSVAPSGTSVHFTVTDTGPGMPADALDRVFDRSYQTEAGRRQKGLGLGLEISKGFVTLHGGTIWAESQPGKGARFHFTIPCAATVDTESDGTPAVV
jgi:signal transduction histidine kinase